MVCVCGGEYNELLTMYLPQATAWIGTVILVVLAVLHLIIVAIYFCKRTKQDDPSPYEPMETEEDKKPTTV